MKTLHLAGCAATAVSAALVLTPVAAHAGPNLEAEFAAMDANADGVLTGAEYKPTGEPVLSAPNTDPASVKGPDGISMVGPDGRLLRLRIFREGQSAIAAEGEVVLTPAQLSQYNLNRLDEDGDGRLSFTEYRAMRIRGARFKFDRSDVDFDERLTRDEYVAQAAPAVSARLSANYTEEQKASLERARQSMRDRAGARFQVLDTDGDGFVSRGEMVPS